jgi:nucleoside 2-deoxyribosyltransferase
MTSGQARARIYLAGPEVFLPDPFAAGRRKVELCDAHGFEGVFPFDPERIRDGMTKLEAARRISLANEALMGSCDLLIANLTPFRGVSMDSGTAFEVGYMRALGRPVLGYTNTTLDLKRRSEMVRAVGRLAFDVDGPEVAIEDFELAENLMIAIAIVESGGAVVCKDVAAGAEMTDLAGFERCLMQAKPLIGVG